MLLKMRLRLFLFLISIAAVNLKEIDKVSRSKDTKLPY